MFFIATLGICLSSQGVALSGAKSNTLVPLIKNIAYNGYRIGE
jgi:hypothetical protein